MSEDRIRATGAPPAGAVQTTEEAMLERYIERESPARDFLASLLRRMPWWTISLLVHLIALLILWQWPYERAVQAALGPEEVPPEVIKVWFKNSPPPVQPAKREDVARPDPDDEPANLYIPPAPDVRPPAPAAPDPGVPVPSPPSVTEPVTYIDPQPVYVVPGPGPIGPGPVGPPGEPPGGPPKTPWIIVKPPPIDIELRNAIKLGLIWLARAQEPDGSWDASRWDGAKRYSVGCTGLSLLAFYGAGYTHRRGDFKTTLARALYWLKTSQRPDGSFPWQTFYEQGIATMALAEAYARTEDEAIRAMAQAAIGYICQVQPEHGGFRYSGAVPKAEGDLSVTGWQIMAIKSAALSGLAVPKTAFERSQTFLANTWRDYGKSAYTVGSEGPGSLAMASAGMLCRVFIDRKSYGDQIMQTANLLLASETRDGSPVPGGASGQLIADLYYTYYSSLAMYQAGQEHWRQWAAMTTKPLCGSQVLAERDAAGRPVKGSWDPARHKWGKNAGRVYTTAMALLALEVPCHYLRVNRQDF